jgi:hypothetical protein
MPSRGPQKIQGHNYERVDIFVSMHVAQVT